MKRLYQNWTVHNLIGHPLMQIFELLGMSKIATRVHDETLPSNALGQEPCAAVCARSPGMTG